MKNCRYLWAMIALLIGVIACASPSEGQSIHFDGTIAVERGTPIPQVEAVEALQTYAQEVLGMSLLDLRAGGRMGEVNLPIANQEGLEVAFEMAGITYWGFWNQGFGSLSVGDSTITGDWTADVQDGSIGIYVVRQEQDFPENAVTALNQVMSTFPNLNRYEFIESPIEGFDVQGFSFSAEQVDDIHIQSWEATLTGTMIYAGVTPGMQGSRSIAWAFIASGALAALFSQ